MIDSYITLGSAVSVGEAKPSREEALRVYENEFVRHYIEETVRFYKVESGRFLDSNPGINGLKDFLKKAELRLDEEQVRSDRYLHFTSVKNAMKECEKAIIGDRKDVFVQSFVPLLEHSQTADLARMFRLAKRVDQGLTPIRSKFEDTKAPPRQAFLLRPDQPEDEFDNRRLICRKRGANNRDEVNSRR